MDGGTQTPVIPLNHRTPPRSLDIVQHPCSILFSSPINKWQALGWLLEAIHMTWAHLEKKRTRLQLYTKFDKENAYSGNIENLALYDHENWSDSRDFIKPIKAISLSQNTSKTHDRRLLELEDQINFLLKGPQTAPRTSSTHVPRAYVEAISSYPHPRNHNEPPKQNSFTFHERVRPGPQLQALETSFKARARDDMAAYTKIMGRFENAIFKQREEINGKMAEMFRLLKELTTSREALGGNTRDLDSIWEETGQEYNFTRSGFKNARTVPGDGVTIPSDAVRIYKRRRQKLCDDIRT
ncbi:hypothetical protein Tco_0473950 [Tanacetum coccineum]